MGKDMLSKICGGWKGISAQTTYRMALQQLGLPWCVFSSINYYSIIYSQTSPSLL